ncbi:efflux RND transporter permease subunit [Candidatus Gracilibacteria bacterium]|nr:efflux RND transporter permease subunit [Candidatus Gracilibacteria bacterium]
MQKQHKQNLLEEAKNSIFTFFIRKKRIAYLLAIGVFLAGIAGSVLISKENTPKIDYGIVNVTTVYNGANAVDIDSLVTSKIESEIKSISGIKKISSTSKNSVSFISVEFDPNVNMSEKMNEIRSSVDTAKNKIPDGAEDPTILRINSSLEPIFNLHLSGDVSNVLLMDYAKDLQDILEKTSFVEEVDIFGQGEREYQVKLDPVKLIQYNLSSVDVINAIKSANKDFPAGYFDINGLDYNLRIAGKYVGISDIENTIVRSLQGSQGNGFILIKDIAKVYQGFEDDKVIEKLYIDGKRFNTVKLLVKKSDKQNIFVIDEKVKKIIEEFGKKNHFEEKGIRIDYIQQMIVDVKKSYETVFKNGIQSILIVMLLMIAFIGVKEGFITGMIIPLSFLATIAVLFGMGESLSFISNFAMILALGIIVDTAIVIVEGIHKGIKHGFTAEESAIISVYEFKGPLISGFLTTIAVFIPLLVLPGVMGKYLSYIPITVSIILTASLLISFFIIPAIAVKILSKKKNIGEGRKISFFKKINLFIEKKFSEYGEKYKNLLEKKLGNKFFRRGVFLLVVALFVISNFLPVKFTMFPSDDMNFFTVTIKNEPGANTLNTNAISREIEGKIGEYPEVKYLETSIQDNKSTILIELFTKEFREDNKMKTSQMIITELQEKFAKYKNYKISVSEQKKGPPSASPVAFRVIVQDVNQINSAQKIVEDVKNILKKIPGTSGVSDDLNNSPGEIKYTIERGKALALGVNPDLIGTILKSAIDNVKASVIQKSGDDLSINVFYDEKKIRNFDDIGNIQIINNKGKAISLNQVVKQELNSSLMNIKRVDGNIAITVFSNLTKDGNALEITNKALLEIDKIQLPDGIKIETAGENSDNKDLFVAMLLGFLAGVFLMFFVLVVQFDSFLLPIIVLFTIVMAQTGVNLGLFLTDTLRSMAFLIGSISLAGIVVNNAIILIDKIKNLRTTYPDENLVKVIAEAGRSRFQPIILTTLTTTAGILPLMWVDSFWRGLSVTIVFGLLFASFLTLIVTPIMFYSIFNKKNK